MKFNHLQKVGTLVTEDYECVDPDTHTFKVIGTSSKDVYEKEGMLLVHDCVGLLNEGLYEVLEKDLERIIYV